MRDCTCVGSCRGAEGLGPGWNCVVDNGPREATWDESPKPVRAFPFDAWHEDDHDVLWWHFPIREPPYVGSPLASDWPFGVGDEGALGWTRFVVPTVRTVP